MNYRFLPENKNRIYSALLFISTSLLLGVLLTAFTSEPEKKATLLVKEMFLQDMARLQQQSKQLTRTMNLLQKKKVTLAQGQKAFHQVKAAYKQVEYLIEYLDPEL